MIIRRPPNPPEGLSSFEELEYYIKQVFDWQQNVVRDLQDIANELTQNTNSKSDPVTVPSATVAELANDPPKFRPTTPVAGGSRVIYVPDETGGAILAYSDGTNWRRVSDGAIVS